MGKGTTLTSHGLWNGKEKSKFFTMVRPLSKSATFHIFVEQECSPLHSLQNKTKKKSIYFVDGGSS